MMQDGYAQHGSLGGETTHSGAVYGSAGGVSGGAAGNGAGSMTGIPSPAGSRFRRFQYVTPGIHRYPNWICLPTVNARCWWRSPMV